RHTISKRDVSSDVCSSDLELRCSRCSMLLLQCLPAGLYNTKPLTSKLRNSSCVPAKHLELRRWYRIMLLLQSMAPSGYSRKPQEIGRASCRDRDERRGGAP